MRVFILKRIGLGIFVLVGLSILIFIIARIIPGDPARTALGPHAPEYAVQNLREQMDLDKPIYAQYALWVKGVVTEGDFGMSLLTRRSVEEDIKELFPATLELVGLAAVFMVLGGVSLGVLAARSRGTWVDSLVRVISYLGIATPSFVWLIMFILLFGYVWPIFPTGGRLSAGFTLPPHITGMVTVDSLVTVNFATFWNGLLHLVLPAIALALAGLSQAARITRSSMVDNMDKDYIALETAYGLSQRRIFSKYLLKISLIPAVSILALDIASLFAWAFICETIVSYPGLSHYGMQAILNKDLNAVVGTVMVLGAVFVLTTIVVDIVVAMLDPRIRLSRRAA